MAMYDPFDEYRKNQMQKILMAKPSGEIGTPYTFDDTKSTTGKVNPLGDLKPISPFDFSQGIFNNPLIQGNISEKFNTAGPRETYNTQVDAIQSDTLDDVYAIISDRGDFLHQGERSKSNLDLTVRKLRKAGNSNFKVVKSNEADKIRSRIKNFSQNQSKLLTPLLSDGTTKPPDIFARANSSVVEGIFDDVLLEQIEEVRGGAGSKTATGENVIKPSQFYNETFGLKIPDYAFSSLAQGEFVGGVLPVSQGAAVGTLNKIGGLGTKLFPETGGSKTYLDAAFQPIYTLQKKSVSGTETGKVSKNLIDELIIDKVPNSKDTDAQALEKLIFLENNLSSELERAINGRDKIINTGRPIFDDQKNFTYEIEDFNKMIQTLPKVLLTTRALLAKAYESNVLDARERITYFDNKETDEILQNLDTSGMNIPSANKFKLKRKKR